MRLFRKIAGMATRSQHAYEALLKRFTRMRAAALRGADPRAVEGLALLGKRHSSDWEPVLSAYEKGFPFPKRRYRPAAAREAQERSARAVAYRPRSRFLVHPAYPSSTVEGSLEMQCQREGCEWVILNVRKQRRYCSDVCRRTASKLRRAAEQAELEVVTVECAAQGCLARVFQLRPDHRFCSTKCRSASRAPRIRVAYGLRPCEGCDKAFEPKTSRARFCSDRCRVRVWDRRQADLNGDTKPVAINR